MNEQIQIDHLQISELVDDYQLDITPAQLHGLITGSVCTAVENPAPDDWFKLIMPYDSLNAAEQEHLANHLKIIYNLTLQELDSAMFEFNPALPDEDSNTEYRTQELAAWCRGFLTTYRQYVKNNESLSEDSTEALQDLSEIAFAVIGDGEEEEYDQALTELEEYLRISIQLIFDDLNPTQTLH